MHIILIHSIIMYREEVHMTPQVLLILILIMALGASFPMFYRTYLWDKFLKQLKSNNAEQALKILNSKRFKIAFGKDAQQYNLLRFYVSQNDTDSVKALINELLGSNINKQQAYRVFSNAYFYFLSIEDKQMAAKLLSRLEDIMEDEQKEQFQMLYRVLIEKKSEDIKRVEELLGNMEKEKNTSSRQSQTGLLQYLLGVQYYYQGNTKESKKWLNRAKTNVKGSPLEKHIKKLLH